MSKLLLNQVAFTLCALVILSLSLAITDISPAKAADECQLFKETGFTICGTFLNYWRKNGGLLQQGLPISPLIFEKNADPPAGDGQVHRVQYYQRARFEQHLEKQPPFDVLLGLLGTEQYTTKYSTAPSPSPQLPGECQTFPETGFSLCGRFLEYWKANGGLTQQGYPISLPFEEQNAAPPAGDGKIHLVQYFQRARFEQHLENQRPFDVLLGLLGAEQYFTKYGPNQPGGLTDAKILATTQVVDEGSKPGICTIESRISASAIFQVKWKPETKNQLLDLICQDAQKNQFKNAEVIVLSSKAELPSGLEVTNPTVFGPDGIGHNFGFKGFHRPPNSDSVILYLIPYAELNNSSGLEAASENSSIDFLRMSYLNGDEYNVNAKIPITSFRFGLDQTPLRLTGL